MKRRVFLKNAGIATAGTCLIPLSVAGCRSKNPNDLITVGMIGTGSHGVDYNLKHYLNYPQLCRVVAVCDVSMSRATSAKNLVNNTYKNKDCKVYQDFRELLDNKKIDAVQISTPDHWHVPISIMAALKGKHVCCEKPTLSIDEGRLLCNVMNKTGVVYQLSMEDRFVPEYHTMAEVARNGRIGEVKHIEVQLPIPKLPTEGLEITNPPSDLDFDLWLGPAREIPYIYARTFFNFRWYDAFSGGILTDWGAHLCDTAQIVANYDQSGPTEVVPAGETLFYDDGIFNTAYKFDLNYRYSNNITLRVTGGAASVRITGEDGWIESPGWRKPLIASNDKILALSDKKVSLPTDEGEHKNFLDCIKSGSKTIYTPEICHRDSTLLHMGNIALKLNRRVQWDPVTEKFINDPEAEKMKGRYMREKWSYEKICPQFKYQ